MFLLFALIPIAIGSWWFVLSKPARKRILSYKWNFFRLNHQQQERDEFLNLAAFVLVAVVSSGLLVFYVMKSILRALQPVQ